MSGDNPIYRKSYGRNPRRTVHELKTWPELFALIQFGTKTFELRKDDRNFAVGDLLWLREYDPVTRAYTDRQETRTIGYILRDAPEFGLMPGYAILGFL